MSKENLTVPRHLHSSFSNGAQRYEISICPAFFYAKN